MKNRVRFFALMLAVLSVMLWGAAATADSSRGNYSPDGLMARFNDWTEDEYNEMIKYRNSFSPRLDNFVGRIDGCDTGIMAEYILNGRQMTADNLFVEMMRMGMDTGADYYDGFTDAWRAMGRYPVSLLDSEVYGWGRSRDDFAILEEYYLFSCGEYGEYGQVILYTWSETNGGEGVGFKNINADFSGFFITEESNELIGDTMYVYNCKEWVSLREEPDTGSERLAKVPFGAMVENAYLWNDDFYVCEYNGKTGFILAEYLTYSDPDGGLMGCQVGPGMQGYTRAGSSNDVHLVDWGCSSHLKASGGNTYSEDNLFDGDRKTAWADGAQGEGVGEYIWASWRALKPGKYKAVGLAIRNGYQKSDDIYRKNSRPEYVWVTVGSREYEALLLDLNNDWQCLVFEQPIPMNDTLYVDIRIDSVYRGSKYTDTCISELDLLIG